MNLVERARRVQVVVFDVDGVFTDGRFGMTPDGQEIKYFHTRDGYGVRRLLEHKLPVAVITGRNAGAVTHRMAELGVEHVMQGVKDKAAALATLLERLGLAAGTHAAMGDDLPDLPLFENALVTATVADGHKTLRRDADIVTRAGGGHGAVREFCDQLLELRGPPPGTTAP